MGRDRVATLLIIQVELAGRAESPEGDLRLIDRETVVRSRIDARGTTDGTVHIDNHAAAAADDVVMVVTGADLEFRGTARRLDPSGEADPGQRTQNVIDGLSRHGVQPLPDQRGDLVDVQMPAPSLRQNFEDGNSGPRDPQPSCSKLILAAHITITSCDSWSLNSVVRSSEDLSATEHQQKYDHHCSADEGDARRDGRSGLFPLLDLSGVLGR
jgi:hypothetical protein